MSVRPIASAAALLLLAAISATADPPPEATAYQITPEHAGVTTSGGVISLQQEPLWTYPVTGAASYPIIAGGRVFLTYRVSSNNFAGNYLVALDAQSGRVLWGPVVVGLPNSWTNATYDSGRLFVVDYRGNLIAFDAATGTPIWSMAVPGQLFVTSAPTARNGLVYVGGSGVGGTLFGVDQATGTVVWLSYVNDARASSPAVTADGFYVTYSCGRAQDFDPINGRLIWQYRLNCQGTSNSTPVYANGRLYARQPGYNRPPGSALGSILSGGSGALLGTFTADPIPAIGATRGYFLQAGVLQGRDLLSQSVAWSFSGDGNLTSAPIVVDDHVFIGSGLGNLYALDAVTGQQKWSTNVGYPIPRPDEYNISSQPLPGLGAANGILVVPTSTRVAAYSLFAPGVYPDQAVAYPNVLAPIDVLANDVGFRDPMSVVVTDAPAHGVATVTGSPGSHFGIRVEYTADAGYTGPDALTYQVTDGTHSGSASVALDVRAAQATDDAVTTLFGTPVNIDVLANDHGFNDPATVTLVAGPTRGSAVVSGSPGGATGIRIDYTPYPWLSGADSLTYQVSDGTTTATATVAITVLTYKARDDSYRVYRGQVGGVRLHVLDNDVGFDEPETLEIQVPPDHGGLAGVSGSPGPTWRIYVDYRPPSTAGVSTERFTYRVGDGNHWATAAATIVLVDYIAKDDVATTRVDEPVTIPVGANDIGFTAPSTATIYEPPSNGTATVNGSPGAPGGISITYQPESDFSGYDSFQYELSDGTNAWVATVSVSVIHDTDSDGIEDMNDNCTLVPNPDQFDGDYDGYGNICDADLNNSGLVTVADFTLLRNALNTADPVADLDSSGLVTVDDFMILRSLLNKSPGPSGMFQ